MSTNHIHVTDKTLFLYDMYKELGKRDFRKHKKEFIASIEGAEFDDELLCGSNGWIVFEKYQKPISNAKHNLINNCARKLAWAGIVLLPSAEK